MRRIFATAVVCLSAALSVNAQSARVSGHVVDSRQGVIQGCEVTIRNTGAETRFRTVTTDSGSFLLPPVPPGTYEITASAPGFAAKRLTGLTLEVGESKVIAFELQPASVHEVVEVVDTPPELTTDRPDRSVVVDQSFVESIPGFILLWYVATRSKLWRPWRGKGSRWGSSKVRPAPGTSRQRLFLRMSSCLSHPPLMSGLNAPRFLVLN